MSKVYKFTTLVKRVGSLQPASGQGGDDDLNPQEGLLVQQWDVMSYDDDVQ